MELIIKEIIVGKYEYDTAVCENGFQIVVERGAANKFVGKKVKFENGVITEVAEPVKVQSIKKPVR